MDLNLDLYLVWLAFDFGFAIDVDVDVGVKLILFDLFWFDLSVFGLIVIWFDCDLI